jgi:c-di-GMP-binding flagellar brake protein YcgR
MERREFVRINVSLPVRYKFLSPGGEKSINEVFSGSTTNISAGGMLMLGKIPSQDYLSDLLLQKVILGINVLLPELEVPLKLLARVRWIESLTAQNECAMGLIYKEIKKADQDKIVQLIIRSQMS